MNRINGYGAYQNSYHTNTVNKKDTAKTSKTGTSKTDGTKKTDSSVQLSDRARALLKELQKTYTNMDFMVADYETDEEAASCLSRGSKEYSVLIDPEELERMAADEDVKEQNLSILDEAVDKLDDMTRQELETALQVPVNIVKSSGLDLVRAVLYPTEENAPVYQGAGRQQRRCDPYGYQHRQRR